MFCVCECNFELFKVCEICVCVLLCNFFVLCVFCLRVFDVGVFLRRRERRFVVFSFDVNFYVCDCYLMKVDYVVFDIWSCDEYL